MTDLVPYADPVDAYPFPIAYSDRWQGGAITDTVVKGVVTICQRQTVAEVVVTLEASAYARWRQEETTPTEDVWPTLWGDVPVQPGRINAVWVPLAWLPKTMVLPGRGTARGLMPARRR